jgi:hypothetical protein
MEQGRMHQPTIDGSGKGKQWLATMRVRGQQLVMAAKGGGGRKRNCHVQRGVIAALKAAEVPGFLVLFQERSKYRTPVFGSILGTISVTSQICDIRFFMCMTVWPFFGIQGSTYLPWIAWPLEWWLALHYLNPITNPTPL